MMNFLFTKEFYTYSPYRNFISVFDIDKIKQFKSEIFHLPYEQKYIIYLSSSIKECIIQNKNINEETKQNILKEETILLYSDYCYINQIKKNEINLNQAVYNCVNKDNILNEYDENCILNSFLDCIVDLNSLDKEIKDNIRDIFYNIIKAESQSRKELYFKWKELIKNIINNKPEHSLLITKCANKNQCNKIFNIK